MRLLIEPTYFPFSCMWQDFSFFHLHVIFESEVVSHFFQHQLLGNVLLSTHEQTNL